MDYLERVESQVHKVALVLRETSDPQVQVVTRVRLGHRGYQDEMVLMAPTESMESMERLGKAVCPDPLAHLVKLVRPVLLGLPRLRSFASHLPQMAR